MELGDKTSQSKFTPRDFNKAGDVDNQQKNYNMNDQSFSDVSSSQNRGIAKTKENRSNRKKEQLNQQQPQKLNLFYPTTTSGNQQETKEAVNVNEDYDFNSQSDGNELGQGSYSHKFIKSRLKEGNGSNEWNQQQQEYVEEMSGNNISITDGGRKQSHNNLQPDIGSDTFEEYLEDRNIDATSENVIKQQSNDDSNLSTSQNLHQGEKSRKNKGSQKQNHLSITEALSFGPGVSNNS